MRAAVVIPVFNEGERVVSVADAALGARGIDEVIVVNDGSTDHTAAFLSEWDNLTVLTHERNRGKGEALDTGMRLVQDRGYDAAVFLDGDLRGLRPDHVDQLLKPIREDGSYMAIGHLGLRNELAKKAIYRYWGGLSGQRAIYSDTWGLLNDRDKRSFGIEAALNARFRKARIHRSITKVALEGVSHVGKREKENTLLRAAQAYGKTYGAALLTYARIETGG